jgi:hypothetical protein
MRELSLIEIIIPILWFFGCLPAEIWRNYHIIEVLKRRPNYLKSTILRVIVGGLLILPIFLTKGVWLEPACFMLSSFGVFFDPTLNKLRGHSLFHFNVKTPGWYDWTMNKLGGLYQVYLLGEVLFLMVSIQNYLIGWDAFVAQVNGTYNWNTFLW